MLKIVELAGVAVGVVLFPIFWIFGSISPILLIYPVFLILSRRRAHKRLEKNNKFLDRWLLPEEQFRIGQLDRIMQNAAERRSIIQSKAPDLDLRMNNDGRRYDARRRHANDANNLVEEAKFEFNTARDEGVKILEQPLKRYNEFRSGWIRSKAFMGELLFSMVYLAAYFPLVFIFARPAEPVLTFWSMVLFIFVHNKVYKRLQRKFEILHKFRYAALSEVNTTEHPEFSETPLGRKTLPGIIGFIFLMIGNFEKASARDGIIWYRRKLKDDASGHWRMLAAGSPVDLLLEEWKLNRMYPELMFDLTVSN